MTIDVPGSASSSPPAPDDNYTPYDGTDDRHASFSWRVRHSKVLVKPELVAPAAHGGLDATTATWPISIPAR